MENFNTSSDLKSAASNLVSTSMIRYIVAVCGAMLRTWK